MDRLDQFFRSGVLKHKSRGTGSERARVGVSIAVANATPDLLQCCDVTTQACGGAGAVREVCDMLLAARGAKA